MRSVCGVGVGGGIQRGEEGRGEERGEEGKGG